MTDDNKTGPILLIGADDAFAAEASRRDRLGARAAYAAGVAGTTANLLLAGFWILIPVAGTGNPLGPANDLTGSLASACMIPAAMAVGVRLPDTTAARAVQRVGVASMAVASAVGPLLVLGVVPFPVATAVSLVAFGGLATWISLSCRWLGRSGEMPRSTARLGRFSVRAAVAAAVIGAAALPLAWMSDPQKVLFGGAALLGAVSWLTVPVWFWLVGRWLDRERVR